MTFIFIIDCVPEDDNSKDITESEEAGDRPETDASSESKEETTMETQIPEESTTQQPLTEEPTGDEGKFLPFVFIN